MESGDPKHPNNAGDTNVSNLSAMFSRIIEDIDRESEEKRRIYDAETKRLSAGVTDPLEYWKIGSRNDPLMQKTLDRTFTVARIQAKELYDLALRMEIRKLQISSEHYDEVLQLQAGVLGNRFVISLPVTPNTRSLAKQALSLFETLLRSKSAGRQINIDLKSNNDALHLIVDLDDFFNLDYLNNLFGDFVDLCSGHKEATDVDVGSDFKRIEIEIMKLRNDIRERSSPSVQIHGNVNGIMNIQQSCRGSKILNNGNTINTEIPEVFTQLREAISQIPDPIARSKIERSAVEMEQAHGSSDFLQKYQAFITSAANHMTILAPIIPAVTALLA